MKINNESGVYNGSIKIVKCSKCNGTGVLDEYVKCKHCNSSGKRFVDWVQYLTLSCDHKGEKVY